MNDWKSISITPPIGRVLLFYNSKYEFVFEGEYICNVVHCWRYDCNFELEDISHWMIMPDAPEVEDDKN